MKISLVSTYDSQLDLLCTELCITVIINICFFSPLLINIQVLLYPHEVSKYIVSCQSLPDRYSELQANEVNC